MNQSPGDRGAQPAGSHTGNWYSKSPSLESDSRSVEWNSNALASAQALQFESLMVRPVCHPLQKAPWPALMNSQGGEPFLRPLAFTDEDPTALV